MAQFNKFQQFVEDLGVKVHDLNSDTLMVYASNTTPDLANDAVKADLAEITQQNGYPGGLGDIVNSFGQTGGIATLTATDVTWTAAGGAFGPLRYIVLYNDTPTSPVDPLIGYWDYSSSIEIQSGETFTVDFGASVITIQ